MRNQNVCRESGYLHLFVASSFFGTPGRRSVAGPRKYAIPRHEKLFAYNSTTVWLGRRVLTRTANPLTGSVCLEPEAKIHQDKFFISYAIFPELSIFIFILFDKK